MIDHEREVICGYWPTLARNRSVCPLTSVTFRRFVAAKCSLTLRYRCTRQLRIKSSGVWRNITSNRRRKTEASTERRSVHTAVGRRRGYESRGEEGQRHLGGGIGSIKLQTAVRREGLCISNAAAERAATECMAIQRSLQMRPNLVC